MTTAPTVHTGSTEARATDLDRVTELQVAEGRRLFDFARSLGLSDDQAADVVQEALLRLWRGLRRGVEIERPDAWLYRTCYRLAMEQHRWRRRAARLLPRLAISHPAYAVSDMSDRLAVWQAVDRLPMQQRLVVYLHYSADLRFDQIAEILGITASSARTHASRGLARLRAALTDGAQ